MKKISYLIIFLILTTSVLADSLPILNISSFQIPRKIETFKEFELNLSLYNPSDQETDINGKLVFYCKCGKGWPELNFSLKVYPGQNNLTVPLEINQNGCYNMDTTGPDEVGWTYRDLSWGDCDSIWLEIEKPYESRLELDYFVSIVTQQPQETKETSKIEKIPTEIQGETLLDWIIIGGLFLLFFTIFFLRIAKKKK